MTPSTEVHATRRPRGRIVVAAIFLLLAINALAQVALVLFGGGSDPTLLTMLQVLVGMTALATAWGSWTGARWSPAAAVLYGVMTSSMLAALPRLLRLPAEARFGIVVGAIGVLAFSLAMAWYLRRTLAAHAAAIPR